MPTRKINLPRDEAIYQEVREGFKSFAEIGDEFGLTRQRIHQIYNEIKELRKGNDEAFNDAH